MFLFHMRVHDTTDSLYIAVDITRSSKQYNNFEYKTSTKFQTHEKQPYPRLIGWAMAVLRIGVMVTAK